MALTKKQRAELRMKFGGRCAIVAVNYQRKAGMLTMLRLCIAKWKLMKMPG